MLKDDTLAKTQGFVGGEWVSADDGIEFDVINPADGSVVGTVADLGAGETRRAISAAEEAQKDWANRTAKARGAILRRWYELFLENKEDLARLMTLEMGKPISESRGEVVYAANFIDWFAEEGKPPTSSIGSPKKGKGLRAKSSPPTTPQSGCSCSNNR